MYNYRVETVLKKLQAKLPVLSEAEKNMQKELSGIREKLKGFASEIALVSRKGPC